MAKEEFRVYNSMTQQKEVFTTKEPGKVGMYVCGITAYDFSHIGHARAAVNFDVLYRYLKHLGYEVTYVRNFTDVDDKIIRRANESGENPFALSDRFCQEYLSDMADLQCLSPTHQPRVSDHLEQIKDMITQIIKNGYGYAVDGDVFFSVDKFPNYGQLSGQKLENHRAGERVAVDSRKRNPADFALWKITERYHPLVLRHFLISAHYRSPLNYTVSQLDSASDTVYYIYQTLQDCEDALSQHQGENLSDGLGKTGKKDPVSSAAEECIINLRSEFQTRMADDLNTAHILTGAFQEALKFINSTLTSLKKKQPKKQQLSMIQSLVNVKKELREVLDVLGLLSTSTYSEVLQQLKDKALKRAGMVEDDILHLIEERTQARKNKDFGKSDNIRAELSSLGIALMDVGKETIWRPCVPVEPAVLVPPCEQKATQAEQKPMEQQVAQPPAGDDAQTNEAEKKATGPAV